MSTDELVQQISVVPTVDEIEKRLSEDLHELRNRGERELGIVGQTRELRGAGKAFEFNGPAEIQRRAMIPPTYTENRDRMKYLNARRFEKASDGRAVQHYAVFYREFLYITDSVLARYSVFYDFIRGAHVGERAPQQHSRTSSITSASSSGSAARSSSAHARIELTLAQRCEVAA